ncbi:hypothetical protein K493DRAFT_361193 [Basidiobolus meristosporus CBS 931.73]|uniref:Uncharacterized protein n=1 Tax=Basidiobolus meristosporus CBS 931.73 TaxID=1314790 RepID=A0A1Y1XBI5_9FUNG|nr:hypothetical protein K493DRAFT_361193 [Basidiobolus meristosporus CBS 931.73]|eukprot:ORX83075.1 hypothetical protein K493DRAFT_361193 [Basidiobolus meristosporus CBS 931.73]
MRFVTVAVIPGLATNHVAVDAPVLFHYAADYYQNIRALPVVKTPNAQSPLLRQAFTTVIRKHNNLNITNANGTKGLVTKYR